MVLKVFAQMQMFCFNAFVNFFKLNVVRVKITKQKKIKLPHLKILGIKNESSEIRSKTFYPKLFPKREVKNIALLEKRKYLLLLHMG